jgi:HPt (histidine-containing phosphotransfer) domain-containing protein
LSDSAAKLDVEFLRELLEGDVEFARELFETYTDSAESSLTEADSLLKSGDFENVFRPFHTLKGASASVGLTGLRALAREFEIDAKSGQHERCQKRLSELREAVEAGKGALQRFLEQMG